MGTQTNLFEMMYEPYKITKPIRLIELFGGIGSQAKALENLNANFEHYRLIEFDKYPVASYNAIHGTNFEPKDITKIKAEGEMFDPNFHNAVLTGNEPDMPDGIILDEFQEGFILKNDRVIRHSVVKINKLD